MKLEGIHHITAITADGPRNVDFYARVLGLRLVKKTVNQDDPTAYHLFYADEQGSHGADLTFFEYPGARVGQAGDGMVHTVVHRVGSDESLDFWSDRLGDEGVSVERSPGVLAFADPEGMRHELAVVATTDAPLIAHATDIPDEHALRGFEAVKAYVGRIDLSQELVGGALAFQGRGEGDWEARGAERGGRIEFATLGRRGYGGAGTVHHVAWATLPDEQLAWRDRVVQAGGHPTEVIDRFYFRSVYFREPSGILYEIATIGPGFTADEPLETLGERLSLPPSFEHLRDRLEPILTPLPDTRRWRRASAGAGAGS